MSDYNRLTEEYQYNCNKCENRQCTIKDSYCKDRIDCEMYNRLAELEDKITQGLMLELPKPKWAVVQGIGGNYFVRERTPKATYYNGKWIFCYEDIEWVDIRFEYDTKAEAEQKLKELLKGDK